MDSPGIENRQPMQMQLPAALKSIGWGFLGIKVSMDSPGIENRQPM